VCISLSRLNIYFSKHTNEGKKKRTKRWLILQRRIGVTGSECAFLFQSVRLSGMILCIGQCFISSVKGLTLLPSSSIYRRLLVHIEGSSLRTNSITAKRPQRTTTNSPKPSSRSSPRSNPAGIGLAQIGLKTATPLILNQERNHLNPRERKQ
jgi:hypothetical protein